MESPNEMRLKIVGRATEDPDFRARLLSDPKGTLEQMLNVTIPASLSIEVHEEREGLVHLILPPCSRLSESDLQEIASSGRLNDAYRNSEDGSAIGNPAAASAVSRPFQRSLGGAGHRRRALPASPA